MDYLGPNIPVTLSAYQARDLTCALAFLRP
jgi:hypothetical protein